MPTKKELNRQKRQRRVRGRISGTPEKPRLCVFRSLRNIHAQIVDDVAGRTLVACSTKCKSVASVLAETNCKPGSKEAAKRVGRCLGEQAVAAGILQVAFDRGGYLYHGRVKAVAEGAREAGLTF
ncbi:MAG TPA: 50S ribosomal protein L18 [bacterium]|nr:50S ribosomal protein L18 [bacterium]